MTSGIASIAAERKRQIEKEGWTAEHDEENSNGEISAAAAAYALSAFSAINPSAHSVDPESLWLWDSRWWKPRTPREDLVRAGALIAAEIDRIDREAKSDDIDESEQPARLETGVAQEGDDWPGIFIRGDSALMAYAPALKALLSGTADPMHMAACAGLADLLSKADVSSVKDPQRVALLR